MLCITRFNIATLCVQPDTSGQQTTLCFLQRAANWLIVPHVFSREWPNSKISLGWTFQQRWGYHGTNERMIT